ncbi:cytochrome C oxidase subunit IV family protein [Texcoconibacillus texcoconensis]|uniref:Cytochrome c oxidase subunit 4 n=1 Tax=Texcoconibacillus texcoconensis TaxID=1095777 RepID=A0A840QLG2_9BACI|nr:cytochrome C oxidase subunit IV family protein [Texcoconibacillus texcoconensis]MBB5172209.1 cytochrome c oxidase subunit 4 [Texcoconibacillus texcoconensis]
MSEHVDPTAPLKGEVSKKTERQLAREMRNQIITFVFMVFLVALSFLGIASEAIPNGFAIPFSLLIAAVMVVIQLYYFMHLKDKGTYWPNVFIWTGIFIAAPTVASLMLLLGVVKY